MLISEKRKGYITDADISSVNFVPELIQDFKSGPSVEVTPGSGRKQISQNICVSAPSLGEASVPIKIKPVVKPQPEVDEVKRRREVIQSVKELGLQSGKEIKRSNSPRSNSEAELTSNNAARGSDPMMGFELYIPDQASKLQADAVPPQHSQPLPVDHHTERATISDRAKKELMQNIYQNIGCLQIVNVHPPHNTVVATSFTSSARVLPQRDSERRSISNSYQKTHPSMEVIFRPKQSSEAIIQPDMVIHRTDRLSPKTMTGSERNSTIKEGVQNRSFTDHKGVALVPHLQNINSHILKDTVLNTLSKIAPSLKKTVIKKQSEEKEKLKTATITSKGVLSSDAQEKISNKINKIFQSLHKTVEKVRATGSSIGQNNRTSSSINSDKKKSTTHAVSQLLHQIKDKRPLRNSLCRPSSTSTSANRTIHPSTLNSFNASDMKASQLDNFKTDLNHVSIYQNRDTISHRVGQSRSPNPTGGYDLLYAREYRASESKSISIHQDPSPASLETPYVLDTDNGIYISKGPAHLNSIYTQSPKIILQAVIDAVKRNWTMQEAKVTQLVHYTLKIDIGKVSLVVRVEALEKGAHIYAVSISPQVTVNTLPYIRICQKLFSSLPL